MARCPSETPIYTHSETNELDQTQTRTCTTWRNVAITPARTPARPLARPTYSLNYPRRRATRRNERGAKVQRSLSTCADPRCQVTSLHDEDEVGKGFHVRETARVRRLAAWSARARTDVARTPLISHVLTPRSRHACLRHPKRDKRSDATGVYRAEGENTSLPIKLWKPPSNEKRILSSVAKVNAN